MLANALTASARTARLQTYCAVNARSTVGRSTQAHQKRELYVFTRARLEAYTYYIFVVAADLAFVWSRLSGSIYWAWRITCVQFCSARTPIRFYSRLVFCSRSTSCTLPLSTIRRRGSHVDHTPHCFYTIHHDTPSLYVRQHSRNPTHTAYRCFSLR